MYLLHQMNREATADKTFGGEDKYFWTFLKAYCFILKLE